MIGTCRTCGLEKELDEETSLEIVEFICFSCADKFWEAWGKYAESLATCHPKKEEGNEHTDQG